MKVGSALGQRAIGAGVGAAMGAGSSLYTGSQQPALAEKVQQMEGEEGGGFLQAARLAAAMGQKHVRQIMRRQFSWTAPL